MNLGEWIASGGGVLIGILTLIQIVPVKVDPWSSIMRALGRSMNVEVMEKLEENEVNQARYRIIRFDDEIRHSPLHHTEEHFNQIIGDIDLYEKYCAKHPEYPNRKAESAIRNIDAVYNKCRETNDFLI